MTAGLEHEWVRAGTGTDVEKGQHVQRTRGGDSKHRQAQAGLACGGPSERKLEWRERQGPSREASEPVHPVAPGLCVNVSPGVCWKDLEPEDNISQDYPFSSVKMLAQCGCAAVALLSLSATVKGAPSCPCPLGSVTWFPLGLDKSSAL